MIQLEAIYTQDSKGRWRAEIFEAPHIVVESAEDLESAQVILRIITAEEVAQMSHRGRRTAWEISKETIKYFEGKGMRYGN